jgi:hypothetical protein
MITRGRIERIDRFRSDGLGVMHFSRREVLDLDVSAGRAFDGVVRPRPSRSASWISRPTRSALLVEVQRLEAERRALRWWQNQIVAHGERLEPRGVRRNVRDRRRSRLLPSHGLH